jgi:hypothetical protein
MRARVGPPSTPKPLPAWDRAEQQGPVGWEGQLCIPGHRGLGWGGPSPDLVLADSSQLCNWRSLL